MAFFMSGSPVAGHNLRGQQVLGGNIAGHNLASSVGARPRALHVVGRTQDENHDICGEYYLIGTHLGRAAYVMQGSGAAIRFWPPMRRWVIDRHGLRDSDVCVAYADEQCSMDHPASDQPLIWHVWDSMRQAHVVDSGVMVIDAPTELTLVGRAFDNGKSNLQGSYNLVGVHHGRPLYHSPTHLIRYDNFESRWFVCEAGQMTSTCVCAYADGPHSQNPGDLSLMWNFWDIGQNKHVPNPTMKVMDAPPVVHVIGRRGDAENRRINGTYHLACAHDSRPLYVQPETSSTIYYCPKQDRWMIDCNDQAEEGLMSHFSNWLIKGDWSAQRCTAFAEAMGTTDPCSFQLDWHIFDSRSGRHLQDPDVRVTAAPIAVTFLGRELHRDNAEVNGNYLICGTHQGFPCYQKDECLDLFIAHASADRWMITRDLTRADNCLAYADSPVEVGHPVTTGMIWHVFEQTRGCFLPDQMLGVVVSARGPTKIPSDAPARTQFFGGA